MSTPVSGNCREAVAITAKILQEYKRFAVEPQAASGFTANREFFKILIYEINDVVIRLMFLNKHKLQMLSFH